MVLQKRNDSVTAESLKLTTVSHFHGKSIQYFSFQVQWHMSFSPSVEPTSTRPEADSAESSSEEEKVDEPITTPVRAAVKKPKMPFRIPFNKPT